MKKKEIAKALEQYDRDRQLFDDFLHFCVEEIRQYLLSNKIWFQDIEYRIKTADRLAEKLNKLHFLSTLYEVRDLIGVRIIFVVDNEIRKFFGTVGFSSLIGRLHIQERKEHFRNPGFHGIYLILGVDPESNDPEISKYKELKCELQITNAIQHAWSQVYHKTIYSQKDRLSHFAKEELEKIESRYQKINDGILKELSDSIHYLYDTAVALSEGATLVTEQSFQQLCEFQNLNELFDRLDTLSKHLVAHAHRVPSSWKPFDIISEIVQRTKNVQPEPQRIGEWELEGKTRSEVLEKVLGIATSLAYGEPERFFDFIFKLWTEEPDIQDRAVAELQEKIKYDLNLLKQVGYHLQSRVVAWLEAQTSCYGSDFDFVFPLTEVLLSLNIRGMTQISPDSFSIPHGAIIANDELRNIRKRILTLAMTAVRDLVDDSARIRLIHLIFSALHQPAIPGQVPESLKTLLFTESVEVISSFDSFVEGMEFPLKFKLQCELAALRAWNGKEGMDVEHIAKFLDRNFSSEDFLELKQFIGVNWPNGGYEEFKKQKQIEESRARVLAETVSLDNWDKWKAMILRIASFSPPLEVQEFNGFYVFLSRLAEINAQLATELLRDHFEQLGDFASFLIAEVWKGKKTKELELELRKHLSNNLFLPKIINGLLPSKELSPSLLDELLAKSKSHNDINSVTNLVDYFVRKSTPSKHIERLFIDAVRFLSERNSFIWVKRLYQETIPIIQGLAASQFQELLYLLIPLPQIDRHSEAILLSGLPKNANAVFEFFLKRIQYSRSGSLLSSYSAVPYDVQKLKSDLESADAESAREFISFVREAGDDERLIAIELLVQLFDISSPLVVKLLSENIESDEKSDHRFALSVLSRFQNSVIRHSYYQQLIRKCPRNDELWHEIAHQLLSVNFYRGDDGLLKMLEGFREEIKRWDDNSDTTLARFKTFFDEIANTAIENEKAQIARDRAKDKFWFDDNNTDKGEEDEEDD